MSVVPDLAAPVAGWRAWRVEYGPRGPELVSPVRPQVWGHRTPTSATCSAGCLPCPSPGCRCGLYAMAAPDRLPLHHAGPVVLGCVGLWGQVVEHSAGWRGEHGYPLVLLVLSAWPPVLLDRLRFRARFTGDDVGDHPGVLPEGEDGNEVGALARELGRLYAVPVHPAEALSGSGRWVASPGAPVADAVRAEAVTGLAARRAGDPAAGARLDRRVQNLLVAAAG